MTRPNDESLQFFPQYIAENVCPSNLSLKRCQPDQARNWTNLAMKNLSTKHITIQSKAIPNFKSFDYIADEDCMPCFMSLIFSPRLQPTVHADSLSSTQLHALFVFRNWRVEAFVLKLKMSNIKALIILTSSPFSLSLSLFLFLSFLWVAFLFLIWRIVYISRFVLMSISNKLIAIFHSLKIKIAIDFCVFCCLFMRLNILAYIISISWFL